MDSIKHKQDLVAEVTRRITALRTLQLSYQARVM
jgi:hypothetical protein